MAMKILIMPTVWHVWGETSTSKTMLGQFSWFAAIGAPSRSEYRLRVVSPDGTIGEEFCDDIAHGREVLAVTLPPTPAGRTGTRGQDFDCIRVKQSDHRYCIEERIVVSLKQGAGI